MAQYFRWPVTNGGGGTGTVTSVGLALPSIFTVTGSPVTTTGTLTGTFTTQSANRIFSGPSTGSAATPTFRALVSADIPSLPYLSTTLGTANGLTVSVNTLSLGTSSASTTGALTSTDWNTFNGKQASLTFGNLTEVTSSVLTITGGTGAVIGSGASIQVKQSSGSVSGYLSSTDWTTFNSKGSGSVTSVGLSVPGSSIFGATGTPVTTSGTLGLTVTGTSGGIPYFDTTSTLSTSAALTANRLVLGGGAGAAPTVVGSLGTTTTVLHGNASGAPTYAAVSLTADVSGVLPIANGGTNNGSLGVTAGGVYYGDGTKVVETAAGSSGQYLKSNASSAPTWATFTQPTIQVFNSTGTTAGRLFTVTSANATVGATYTNNGNTFTVLETISAATRLFTSGVSAPLSSGTLTKSGGTGDATITFSANQTLATYTTPANVVRVHFQIMGPGGGGGGAGVSGGSAGGTGTVTSFGPAFSTALGGAGGGAGSGTPSGGAGGSSSVGSGLVGFPLTGGSGSGGAIENVTTNTYLTGGVGGSGYFGGNGAGSVAANTAGAGAANTGGGGGGGSVSATTTAAAGSGGGGGSGGYVEGDISSPAGTLYYSVGTGGIAGTVGTIGTGSASAGGAGGDGKVIIWEYYQ